MGVENREAWLVHQSGFCDQLGLRAEVFKFHKIKSREQR